MAITPKGLEQLLKMTANTADHELTCEESGESVHRYVEFRVSGTGELPKDLRGVEQHLSVCPDCVEIVEAIIAAVREERGSDATAGKNI
jgi:hypothetical protein